MTRTGKIARLPSDIRETVNTRIADGHMAKDIMDWLNEQPVVKEVLEKEFEGEPISDANMSSWKQGGYRDWRKSADAAGGPPRALASFMAKLNAAQRLQTGCLPDDIAQFLAVTLAMECDAFDSISDEKERQKALGALLDSYAQLRGGDLDGSRFHLERQKLAALKLGMDQRAEESKSKSKPQRTPAERQAIIRQILSAD